MKGTKNLTQGPILRQLFTLAMPIMATSFIQMAYSLTDMAWVGRLGSEAIAAVGSVGILTWMSTAIALLNKVGAEVNVGQAIGAQDEQAARNFASNNITLALLISVLWGAILFIFARPIISIYELQPHIEDMAVEYLRIISTALPFVFLSTAFTGTFNAAGRSKIPFSINGIGLITNIILDPLLIFGLGWGTTGAAIATWLAEAIVCFLFVYQLKKKKILWDNFIFFTHLKKQYAVRIIKIGLPVATFNTLFAFVNMFLGRTASEQGGHLGLMALTTGGQIEAITWNTSQGFATALSAFVAQNYAARQVARVLKAYHTTLWMTFIFGTFCTFIFICYGNEIFSIFVPEKAAYETGGVFLRIDGYSQIFMMLEITIQGVFYGIGRTMPACCDKCQLQLSAHPDGAPVRLMGMGIAGHLVERNHYQHNERDYLPDMVYGYQEKGIKLSG